MNDASNGRDAVNNGPDNGPDGPTSSESDASRRVERVRLVKAIALGFGLGVVLARWGERAEGRASNGDV